MRKYILFACSFLLAFLYVIPADAAQATYPMLKAGEIQIYSSGDKVGVTTFYVSYNASRFTFRVPVSDVGADDCIVLTSDSGSRFYATFFWSSLGFSDTTFYWASSGSKQLSYSSSQVKLLTGDLDSDYLKNQILYEQPAFIEVPDGFSSGYFFVSGHMEGSARCDLKLTVMPLSEARPTPEPTPEPTSAPTPEPTPAPTAAPTAPPFSGISGPSESLGTFGTADGTQTEAYGAFMRLYNKLFNIVTDDSVPEPAPTGFFPDLGAVSSGAQAVSMYGADQPVGYAADYDTSQISASALVDKWLVRDGQTVSIGESWNLSPYSVEVAETGATLGQEYRDGNAYILHYRLRLPVRFNYMGHTGSGLASPQIIAGLSVSYEGDPAGSFLHSFGTPSVSLVQDASYDLLCTLGFHDDGLSGDVGAAFNNIPILDWAAQTSYEILVDFPLYISALSSPTVFPNSFQYEVSVTLETLELSNLEFIHVSDQASSSVLEDIAAEQKKQHELENERYEQEQETINQATGTASDGLSAVTETLSSWEIFTMPVTVTKDFITAITSSSSANLTFPTFSIMGYTLWPSYTFDLNKVAELFPLLYGSLHLISGILVVLWFLRYLWRKWSLITGDDLPDGEGK